MKPTWESLNPQNQLQYLFLNHLCPPESRKEADDALSSLKRVDLRRCGGNSGKATNADGWVPRGQSLQDSSAPPHSHLTVFVLAVPSSRDAWPLLSVWSQLSAGCAGSPPVCRFPSRKQSPSRVKLVLKLSSWKSEHPSGGSIRSRTASLP